jgi:hypothetical protein
VRARTHTHLLTTHTGARHTVILEGLRSGNELRQQESALELAEILLLGNEETLATLPVRDVVHTLTTLMSTHEHNLELVSGMCAAHSACARYRC